MHDVLQKFFAHPGCRSYLRVRERILARRRGRAQPDQLVRLVDLFATGDHRQVRTAIESMMPAWALSPAVYWLGSCAALETGDADAAEVDRFLYQCCLQGILSTGDGTAERPFHITYASDMDEVLYRLALARSGAELRRGPHGMCDVAVGDSGEQVWFLLGAGVRDEMPLHNLASRAASTLVR